MSYMGNNMLDVASVSHQATAAAPATTTGIPWVTIITAMIGGGVFGSLVSTYVASGREGRQARAKVRECLFDTENTRWTDTDYRLFRQAISRLEAAVLIARAPREIVRRYVYLADVAHYTQLAKEKADPNYPPRGLPLELALLVELAVTILVEHLWHPWSKRHLVKHDAWTLDIAIEAAKGSHPDFAWMVQLFRWKTIIDEPGTIGLLHRRAEKIKRRTERLLSWAKGLTPKGRRLKMEASIPMIPIAGPPNDNSNDSKGPSATIRG
jgi:hypothetical protein